MKLSWASRITILRILLIIPFVSFMLKINDPKLSTLEPHYDSQDIVDNSLCQLYVEDK